MGEPTTLDLPAIYHEHEGPTDHRHENTGPGHYIGDYGHYHLTDFHTAEEIGALLGVAEEGGE